jgi:hypothetical protein
MTAKAVTEAALKFWILELLTEDPKAQWPELEKFFQSELREGKIQFRHIAQARNIYRNLRSRYPATTGETQRRSG